MLFGKSKTEKIEIWGKEKKLEKLIPYLKDKDPALRACAVKALSYDDSDNALNALISMLHDRDLSVRMAVISSLVAIKRPSAAEHIRHAYGKTSEPEFIEACKNALSAFVDLQKGN